MYKRQLDEAFYTDNEPIDGFIQAVPDNGQPVSERTEAWISFDDTFIYISAKLYESVPESQWVANEIRRDWPPIAQCGAALGLAEAQLDGLFALAATL